MLIEVNNVGKIKNVVYIELMQAIYIIKLLRLYKYKI